MYMNIDTMYYNICPSVLHRVTDLLKFLRLGCLMPSPQRKLSRGWPKRRNFIWFTFQQIRILAAVTNPACYVLRAFWDSNNEHSKSWSFEFATFLSSQQELQSQIGDDNPLQFRCSFQIRWSFSSIWSVACANYYQHELFLHELFLHENVRI